MTGPAELRRGQVWAYPFVEGATPKPAIIVSADARNASRYPWVHVVRVTTRPKSPLPTIVELAEDDPVVGRAMCDEVEPVHRDDLAQADWNGRALSQATMARIDRALRLVLDLD